MSRIIADENVVQPTRLQSSLESSEEVLRAPMKIKTYFIITKEILNCFEWHSANRLLIELRFSFHDEIIELSFAVFILTNNFLQRACL